jgi:dihydroorotate dehydrogenase electron transfer subunit
MSEANKTAKGVFEAVVTANKQIGSQFGKLKLTFSGDGAKAFAGFRPGQFAELDLTGTALPSTEKIPSDLVDTSGRNILLRRPFSFTDVTIHGDKTFVEILYCVVGPASLRMTTLSAGDSLNVIGPLGNGFRIPDNKKYALLTAGGMGTPPLQHLAKVLSTDHKDIEVIVFVGAKTKTALPFEGRIDEVSQQLGFSLREFAQYGFESIVATDDGSTGHKGFVTDCLTEWLEQTESAANEIIIYSCGPEEMLAKVAEIAAGKNIDCQISMERRMACGIGLCQSCAIECRVPGSSETVYKMCCEDGPVFDGKEIVFSLKPE